jgi:hypothetical protein
MADVILSTDELAVFGGPASINVDIDFGTTGVRGSRIIGVDADPRLATTEKPVDTINYDLAMVVSPSESDYLTVYQKIGTTTDEWLPFASLVPNVFSTKGTVTFVDGIATGIIPISDLFTLDVDGYIADNFMVNISLENKLAAGTPSLLKPVSTGFSLSTVDSGGKKYLLITTTAIEYNISTLSWLPVTGERVAHLFITSTSGIQDEVTL